MSVIITNTPTENTTVSKMLDLPEVENWEDLAAMVSPTTPASTQCPTKSQRKRTAAKAKKAAIKAAEAKEWESVKKETKTKRKRADTSPSPQEVEASTKPSTKPSTKSSNKTNEAVNTTLVLKNLPYNNTWVHELMGIFEHHGELELINVLRNEDDTCKGIAFIRFKTSEGADKAVRTIPDFWYHGRKVFVEYARDKRK